MKSYPNVLFLMSDEHRFDVSGFAGNPIVRTPNLDRLAQDAVVFDNAYSPGPVCVPARQCMAVGKYPHQCGVMRFEDDLPPQSNTFARRFTETGYRTVASGKLHHHGMDQMQGWQVRIAGDCEIDRRFFTPGPAPALAPPVPGRKWSESREIRRAGPGDSAYARRDRLAVQGLKDGIYEQFVDSYYDRADPDQPVLLYLGLLNPHYPYIAQQDLFDYYLNRVQPYPNKTPFPHPFLGKCPNDGPVVIGEQVTEREARRAMAAYYANIETIDRQFGEILHELEQAGQDLDDWIIVYTSDHGELLGEHGVWEKQKFFEGSARVPLFIRFPKRFAPRRVQQNVNLVDLYATLCELCGVQAPAGIASRSLVPLLEGNAAQWNNETFSEWDDNLMVKQDALKYHLYPDGSELLFDLAADPGETRSVLHEEAYTAPLQCLRERARQFLRE